MAKLPPKLAASFAAHLCLRPENEKELTQLAKEHKKEITPLEIADSLVVYKNHDLYPAYLKGVALAVRVLDPKEVKAASEKQLVDYLGERHPSPEFLVEVCEQALRKARRLNKTNLEQAWNATRLKKYDAAILKAENMLRYTRIAEALEKILYRIRPKKQ